MNSRFLNDTQQLCLGLRTDSGDFVKEKSLALISHFQKRPFFRKKIALVECAFYMPEKVATSSKSTGIEPVLTGTKRLYRHAAKAEWNGLGNQFLAGTAFHR